MSKDQKVKTNAQVDRSRLHREFVKSKMIEKFGYKNVMSVPSIKKVVLNMGLKEAVSDSKVIDQAVSEMFLITGQKPMITRARKSIAGFKLREGAPIGVMVTLRGNMMYSFLDRFINVALPRTKDFKGFSPKNFDGRGNFSVGVKEQIIFPEINYDKIDKIRGMNISVVTSANTDAEALALLEGFYFPFAKL